MFNRITAMYIGNNLNKYKDCQSVDELKIAIYKQCRPHITDDSRFKKGARIVDWESMYEALEANR